MFVSLISFHLLFIDLKQTCDIGLTQNRGQSGLCFEIWFRRRRTQDTYTLQAERQDVKEAWTADLQHILWDQALKNRGERERERQRAGERERERERKNERDNERERRRERAWKNKRETERENERDFL